MKRIIFYSDPEWAIGSITHELCKYLFLHGYDANVLSWKKCYSVDEFVETDKRTHCWVTLPDGYNALSRSYRCIDASKVVVICHATSDIDAIINLGLQDDIVRLMDYCAVAEHLVAYSRLKGIKRIPKVLKNGINYSKFHCKPSFELNTVGFAGFYLQNPEGMDEISKERHRNKRGDLVKRVCEELGLNLKIANTYHNSFVTMNGFYSSVDCVIVPSMYEAAGMPTLEAGAAGRLVLGTPVGHWTDLVTEAGGITCPMQDDLCYSFMKETLSFYRNNPIAYQEKCISIQKHAKSYDWSNFIKDYIAVFDADVV